MNYVQLDDMKAGDWIELDGGFTCEAAGEHKVHEDELGLYFECHDESGRHYLDGQDDGDGRGCIGVLRIVS